MGFWENVKSLNDRWNDLPRRIFIVLLVLCAMLLAGVLFPYIAPMAIAMVLAWVVCPVARLLENAFRKIHLPAKLASLIAVLVMYGAVSFLLFWVGQRVFMELRSLISALPGWAGQAVAFVRQWTEKGGLQMLDVSPDLLEIINRVVSEAVTWVTSFVSQLLGSVASWTFYTAMNLPQIVLFVVLTIMGTFYMVADRARIFAFFHRWIPKPASEKLIMLRGTVFHGIAGQVKCALLMMAMITVELSIGFSVLKVPYAVLLALAIGVMDALPIIGAGLFLLPMSVYGFVVGNYAFGVGVAVLYILTIVIRQIVEPRVVSVQLGLYPLVTMTAMYFGLRLLGFVGMLLAPVVALILKAALSGSDHTAVPEKRKSRRVFHKRKKNPPAAGA